MTETLLDRIQDLERLALRQGERLEILEERLAFLLSHVTLRPSLRAQEPPGRSAA